MTHLVIGTAGHIDHGKSSLVLALTGTDPDRLKEEKARGITIDLGFAHWAAPGLDVAFVDVPGHERFVKNMLAGAGGVDAVMLVVAADESVMPQTREHFEICRLLQVPTGLIVLTKIDLVDPDMAELVRLEVCDLVRGSFLEHAPVIGASAKTGQGLDEVRAALRALTERVTGRPADGPARLPVDRVFSVKGFGTVVTGTLVSGRLAVDADVVVLPGARPVKVRGVQVHGRREDVAVAGQRVAVNLAGVEVTDLERGSVLAGPASLADTRLADIRFELLPAARPLRHGARVRFHQGTTEVLGRVALSGLVGPSADDEAPAVGEVPPGRSAYARVRFERPAVVTRGDRFILRAYSPPQTIAGGVVVDPHPPRGGIRTASGRARFACLDPVGPAGDRLVSGAEAGLDLLLAEAATAGVPVAALSVRLGLTPAQADAVRRTAESAGRAVTIGDVLLAAPVLAERAAAVVRRIDAHHRGQPLDEGLPREEAREQLFPRAAPGVFDRVLDDLARSGRIVARERLALASHRLALSPAESEASAGLERVYREAGLAPPALGEAAAALGQPAPLVEKMAALLVRQKVLVRIDALHFHAAVLSGLKQDLAARKAAAGGQPVSVDVPGFKDRYGVTRKFAIPLLEYLDRERVTRRVGDARVLL